MFSHTNDVEEIFPHQIGTEIESTLNTMKDLREDRRAQLNSHISSLIQEKRSGLFKIKDKQGNEAAYFIIGMLFVWDSWRISMSGTGQERMMVVTVHFQTPEGETVIGYASVAKYFFGKYTSAGGNDPGYLSIIRNFGM